MLSARKQQALEEIEKGLRRSDSQLVSRFSLFAELVEDQAMPRREELPSTPRQWMAQLFGFAGRAPDSSGIGRPPWALLLLPLMLVAIVCTLLLAIASPHSGAGCARLPGPGLVSGEQLAPGQPVSWPGCAPKASAARHR